MVLVLPPAGLLHNRKHPWAAWSPVRSAGQRLRERTANLAIRARPLVLSPGRTVITLAASAWRIQSLAALGADNGQGPAVALAEPAGDVGVLGREVGAELAPSCGLAQLLEGDSPLAGGAPPQLEPALMSTLAMSSSARQLRDHLVQTRAGRTTWSRAARG